MEEPEEEMPEEIRRELEGLSGNIEFQNLTNQLTFEFINQDDFLNANLKKWYNMEVEPGFWAKKKKELAGLLMSMDPFNTIPTRIKKTKKLPSEQKKIILAEFKEAFEKGSSIEIVPPDKKGDQENFISPVFYDKDLKTFLKKYKEFIGDLGSIEPEKLHKQSRILLKTLGRNIGRDKKNPSLFHFEKLAADKKDLIQQTYKKEIIPGKAATLCHLLLQIYQEKPKDEDGFCRIENLYELSEALNTTNYDLKLYFQLIGAYQYPIPRPDPEHKEITIYYDKIFTIGFGYRDDIGYSKNEYIGPSVVEFIKNETVRSIKFKPNEFIIKDLAGKSPYSNVLVSNSFVNETLELSDMAKKIYFYASSNMPSQKLGEDKFYTALNLQDQIKSQGKPRIREQIKKGFEELIEKGLMEYWKLDKKLMYDYKYTNKLIKHSHFQKVKEGK